MNKKILAIIKSDKQKFLLLRTNPKWLKVDMWYVVTGAVEKQDRNQKEAVKREVEEETGLKILEIKETDYVCNYEWPKNSGKMHKEKAFLVKVEEDKPKLSGEHLAYKWLDKKEFIQKIDWYGNKKELRKLIEQ